MYFVCFPVAVPFNYGVFGRGTGKIMLYGISCIGSPSRLVDCSYSLVQGSYSGGCYLREDAGIRCYGMLLACDCTFYIILGCNLCNNLELIQVLHISVPVDCDLILFWYGCDLCLVWRSCVVFPYYSSILLHHW